MKRIVEQTADGSATLFIPEMDEHYHPVKGARTESQYIFIDMGLKASELHQPHLHTNSLTAHFSLFIPTPPSITLSFTLFPYTTLFRSHTNL